MAPSHKASTAPSTSGASLPVLHRARLDSLQSVYHADGPESRRTSSLRISTPMSCRPALIQDATLPESSGSGRRLRGTQDSDTLYLPQPNPAAGQPISRCK